MSVHLAFPSIAVGYLRQIAAMAALLLGAASPAFAAAVGMVTDLTGKVWMADGAIRKPLAILTYLEPGMVIELDKGSSLSLTFYSPPDEYVFSDAAKFRIEKQGISKISGAAPVVQRLGALVADAAAKEMAQGGRRTQAAVRMRSTSVGKSITGLSPDKTKVQAGTPRMSWVAQPEAKAYRLTISTAEGIPVFEETVGGTEWRVPAEKALAPGKEYIWRVETTLADGLKIGGKAHFAVLDAGTAAGLTAESPKKGASFAQRLRHAITLEAAGLNEEARELWRELARERPTEPAVQQRIQP